MTKKSFKEIRDATSTPKSIKRENIDKIEEENKEDLISRMIKGYNRNKDKINGKPKKPELSQSDKRKRKLADLKSRSSSWKGLESFENNI